MHTHNRISRYWDIEQPQADPWLALLHTAVKEGRSDSLAPVEPLSMKKLLTDFAEPDFDYSTNTIHGSVRGCETPEEERRDTDVSGICFALCFGCALGLVLWAAVGTVVWKMIGK